MKVDDYFAQRNGGKPPQDMVSDNEMINPMWCRRMMIDYAKEKCKEQREICGDYLVFHEPGGIYFRDQLKTIMRNAPEPK